jgi:undecaprenyl-diphosphatase
LLVLGTIPVGISGLLLEHVFRTVLGKPIPAATFLIANGVILLVGERLRRAGSAPVPAAAARPRRPTADGGRYEPDATVRMAAVAEPVDADRAADDRLATMPWGRGLLIGSAQVLALLPGVSRSGVTMVAGLLRGLSHEDAARFSFLLATPVILAAGVLKIPDLTGQMGAGIRGQVLAGSLASFVAAYLAVRFLTRYFQTRTLTPFAFYCMAAGLISLVWLGLR